ncbi:MAG: hypothetical protein ABEJ68_00505 [Halobacteriaceae archaeon]
MDDMTEESAEEFAPPVECPAEGCTKEGDEHPMRDHLAEDHGWSEAEIEHELGEAPSD